MSDGALLELVSRGKKDAYYIQDPVRTWFGSPYDRRSPSTREIRLLYPDNPPRFGQTFDITIPSDGDILTSFDLRITMPTWLPPRIAALNKDPATIVRVESNPYVQLASNVEGAPAFLEPIPHAPVFTEYGWVDGIANYMINRWALFVDNVMVLDGWGEFNIWYPDMDATQMHAPLIHASTGRTNGNIQRNATLPELVFRVLLPGCQGKKDTGLPICAFKNQKIYVRFYMLDKTQLVESGRLEPATLQETARLVPTCPLYELCPTPWGGRRIQVNGVDVPEVTLSVAEMGQPYIYARCGILNVENELRASLAAQKFEIRFRQQLRDFWTVDGSDFVAGINYRQLLQINGFFQTLFVGFRSLAREKQNKYTDILPSFGEWLTDLSLNVNGQDRIYDWPPSKFRTLANNTQLGRDVNFALYYIIFGISPEDEPGGACNLSRCQKAAVNLTFAGVQPDPMTNSNLTSAFILGMSWNVLDIQDGYATLRFPT